MLSVFNNLAIGRSEFLKCLILLYITEELIFCSFDVMGSSTQNESQQENLDEACLSKWIRKSCLAIKEYRGKIRLILSHIREETWHCPISRWVLFIFFDLEESV